MNLPTLAQASAFGRHVVSYAMGATTMLVAIHILNGDQGASVAGAIQQIASGITSIAGGVATLISIGTGIWAAWTASPKQQLLAVAANPDVAKVVAPTIAASVPSDKVVAQ
jgi:hypothetical protein